ncbi:tetratricopeptide repeat protein [[Clostridium] hylemonae DSM 15053]|uniref:Tetratricopeptide repeat protein n=2 Tax=[Clostridium] hylemonae TaxID=89153 RepID=C0C6E8_9FIRM|nr:tetratricopeptide repeat protein [[Clostridium] hylemonae]EEG72283.1 tetratricopeptide repeat protein [[Clostridium] hylemonae DSM 15053]QEK16838.1 hypothetical protein LAJLEIBI_00840 [[Clostridium] hylemonae DSM 15053]
MICKECNTENPQGAKFCLKCGKELEQEQIQNVYKKKTRKTLYISIITLVICITALMGFKVYSDTKNYNAAIKRAERFYASGKYDDAVREYEKAMDILPENGKAYTGLAYLYRDLGEFSNSYNILETANEEGIKTEQEVEELKEYEEKYNFLMNMSDNIYSGRYQEVYDTLESVTADEYGQLYMQNGKIVEKIEDGPGIIFNVADGIYVGDIMDGFRNGNGIQIGYYNESYYYADGLWEEDMVNGECTLYYDNYGGEQANEMYVVGNYTNNLMDGEMEMRWRKKGEEDYSSGTARAVAGEFKSLGKTDDDKLIYVRGDSTYWSTSASGLKDNGVPFLPE